MLFALYNVNVIRFRELINTISRYGIVNMIIKYNIN